MSAAAQTETNPEIGQTITAAGIKTNFHDIGAGRPVLLIHGSGPGVSGWANWRVTIPALAKEFRVIAPDMVGFGFTERPADVKYSKVTWMRHAIGLLDALKLDQVDIVGNSFGGALALTLAVEHPARIRRLVLMGSAGLNFPLTEGLDFAWGYTPSLQNMRKLLDVFAFNRNLVTDELAEMRFRAASRPGIQEAYASMFPAPRQRGIESLAVDEAEIAKLQQPTLIFHGREDRILPPEVSQRLFALIPNAELHMFANCGHWTQIEHAGRFNELVAGFLRG